MQGTDTCVVIPVNSEACVLHAVLSNVTREFSCVVCVDDGSTDASAERIVESGAVLVRHPVNLGHDVRGVSHEQLAGRLQGQ